MQPSRISGMAAALAVMAAAFAVGLAPAPQMTTSAWAEEYRVVPDKSAYAGKWRNDVFPPLVEIMDRLSPHDPAQRVTVLKPAQVGVSEVLANAVFAFVDLDPCDIMIVHPTRDGVRDWDVEKFQPAIDATPRMKAKIRPAKSRDGDGSTARRKRFLGGDILLAGANSAAGLRQHSVRALFKDDWSGWPRDVDGQGDPDRMAEARQDSFRASGRWKTAQVSTPTNAGSCRTTAAYDEADHKGRWLCPCPDCGHRQELRFFPDGEGRGGLRWNDQRPYEARYACAACGVLIPETAKRAMVAAGAWAWEHVFPDGHHWAFRFSKVIAPSEPWDSLVAKWLSAKGDPEAERAFFNLDEGQAYEEKGDAPKWEVLKKRAEDYPPGRLPAGAWLVTIGCDVQAPLIYYEAVAWGPGRESWSIEAGQLHGDTALDPGEGEVWQALDALYERRWPLANGRAVQAEMLAIDAGFHTDQVCRWVARRPYAMAVKGAPGWGRGIFGLRPQKQETTFRGTAKKRGVAIWPVFVWSLKGELYANLAKEPTSAGWEAGACHFPTAHPDAWFQQLTADYLHRHERKGAIVQEWRTKGENHWHDCRIYARAGLHRAEQRLGLAYGDAAAWARLIRSRGGAAPAQGELMLDAAAGMRQVAGTVAAPAPGLAPDATSAPESAAAAPPAAAPPRVVTFAARRVVRNSLARA
ncbi:MAG: phage terminase large subunit family protein [Alphaproteobacteria bacterium]